MLTLLWLTQEPIGPSGTSATARPWATCTGAAGAAGVTAYGAKHSNLIHTSRFMVDVRPLRHAGGSG